jgi:peptide-methionine (S)-S-oxide reductase
VAEERAAPSGTQLPRAGFGGGCHWCTEAVFAALRGVVEVRQGFIRSHPPDDALSEAVLVTWEPEAIPLEVLVEIHLRTHASSSDHSMRGKYRSAVYTVSAAQAGAVDRILARLRTTAGVGLVTRVLPFAAFEPSDPRFHGYAEKNAGNQFCTRYIDPKLAKLRADYARYLRPEDTGAV